ncbi:MAG: carboxypeptidase-like regulatory domain-containing protein [Planctomycetes bacterium]|nr:carboxypeptidase-like regulatory domain-containing protein [Planctomycetota bacterium]
MNRALDVRDAQDALVRHASEPDHVVRIRGLVPRAVCSIAPIVDGRPSFALAQEVVLEPGEIRELALAAPRELRGVLIDAEGAPIAQCVVWLAADDDLRRHYFSPCQRLIAVTETDDAGRFTFREVAAGGWVVGPGFRGASIGDCFPEERLEACASAIPTPVLVGDADVDIVLRAWCGLFLRGSARLASGEPCVNGSVRATNLNSGLACWDEVSDDGRFRIGPLERGRFRVELFAGLYGIRGPSSEVEAWAGDSDLVLRAEAPLTLRVVCEPPTPVAGLSWWVNVSRIDASTGAFRLAGGGSGGPGAQVLRGLEPGEYVLSASAGTGLFGVLAGVHLVAGEPETTVTIPLAPARQHALVVRGHQRWVHVRVIQRGCVVVDWVARAGTSQKYSAFSESVRVELRNTESDVRPLFSGTFDPGTLREPLVIDLDR